MSGFSGGSYPKAAGFAATSLVSRINAFGEPTFNLLTPTSQATLTLGLSRLEWLTQSNGTGAIASAVSGSMVLESGTSTSGTCVVHLHKGLTYRSGQGSLIRQSAIFNTGVANTLAMVGGGNDESGFYFGYNGINFGIFHQQTGQQEVRRMTITAGVATSTDVTMTLGDAKVTKSIAGGGNIKTTAWELSQQNFNNVGVGWQAEACGADVYFVSLRPNPVTGTFSAAALNMTSSFVRHVAGTAVSRTFTSQSLWNIDPMNGTGPSGGTLDPTKGNVYHTSFQYLGFGNTKFAIEDQTAGIFIPVHNIQQANTRTSLILSNPRVFARWSVENSGSLASTYVSGSSGATFTEGQLLKKVGLRFAVTGSKTSVTTEVPVISLRADRVFDHRVNFGSLETQTVTATIAIGGSGTRTATIAVYKDGDITGPVNFTKVSSTRSIASYDIAATGYAKNTTGELIDAFVLGGEASITDRAIQFHIGVGETMTITCAANNSADIDVTLAWLEDS